MTINLLGKRVGCNQECVTFGWLLKAIQNKGKWLKQSAGFVKMYPFKSEATD